MTCPEKSGNTRAIGIIGSGSIGIVKVKKMFSVFNWLERPKIQHAHSANNLRNGDLEDIFCT